jgi:hypothetical protein
MQHNHERLYAATDKLIHAFFTDNLVHLDCKKCAVGNMCSGNKDWVFIVRSAPFYKLDDSSNRSILTLSGNYSISELVEIEKVFENDFMNKFTIIDLDGFEGLCRVFDTLISFENWSEEEKKVNLFEMIENN